MPENFVCAIEANARRFGAKAALLCNDGKLTWSELDGFAAAFSRYLSSQGVSSGDRVAILLPNGVEFVVAFLAILKSGATPAPLNPLVKNEELAAFQADEGRLPGGAGQSARVLVGNPHGDRLPGRADADLPGPGALRRGGNPDLGRGPGVDGRRRADALNE
jgi:long-chain acyl-CoA synthetase